MEEQALITKERIHYIRNKYPQTTPSVLTYLPRNASAPTEQQMCQALETRLEYWRLREEGILTKRFFDNEAEQARVSRYYKSLADQQIEITLDALKAFSIISYCSSKQTTPPSSPFQSATFMEEAMRALLQQILLNYNITICAALYCCELTPDAPSYHPPNPQRYARCISAFLNALDSPLASRCVADLCRDPLSAKTLHTMLGRYSLLQFLNEKDPVVEKLQHKQCTLNDLLEL